MATAKKAGSGHPFLSILKMLLRLFYPNHSISGTQNVSLETSAVFVCNHLETYSPIVLSLYFPYAFRPWVHAHLMDRSRCMRHLDMEFAQKTLRLRPPLSTFIAAMVMPMCIRLMKAIGAIPVFKGEMRIRETFDESVQALKQGSNLLLFPENPTKRYSRHINEFHSGFAHLASLYFRQTGRHLDFYPVYIDKQKRKIIIGQSIQTDTNMDHHKQRIHITAVLRDSVNEIAEKNMDPKHGNPDIF